jgi:hypothetical protein
MKKPASVDMVREVSTTRRCRQLAFFPVRYEII